MYAAGSYDHKTEQQALVVQLRGQRCQARQTQSACSVSASCGVKLTPLLPGASDEACDGQKRISRQKNS